MERVTDSEVPSLPPIRASWSPSSSMKLENSLQLKGSEFDTPLAPMRWEVEKQRQQINATIERSYDEQMHRYTELERRANKQLQDLYSQLQRAVDLAQPPLPRSHQRLFIKYGRHLVEKGCRVVFAYEKELLVWNAKSRGTRLEKAVNNLATLAKKIFDCTRRKEQERDRILLALQTDTEMISMRESSALRWRMEKIPTLKRNEYFSLWHLATNNNIRELNVLLRSAKKMEEYPAGINELDPDFKLSALHYATRRGHVQMTRFLLDNGADPCIACPTDGRTALHFAAMYANAEVVSMLLISGLADSDPKDHNGLTPLDLSVQNDNKKTIPLLQHWKDLLVVNSDAESEKLYPEIVQQQSCVDSSIIATPSWYQPIPQQRFGTMSKRLQVLFSRLNGHNPYISQGHANQMIDPRQGELSSTYCLSSCSAVPEVDDDKLFIQIRLCTKAFPLCIHESFLEEGIQLMRRRWECAKQLLDGRESRRVWKEQATLPPLVPAYMQSEAPKEIFSFQKTDDKKTSEKQATLAEERTDLEELATKFLRNFTTITYLPPPAEEGESLNQAQVDLREGEAQMVEVGFDEDYDWDKNVVRIRTEDGTVHQVERVSDRLFIEHALSPASYSYVPETVGCNNASLTLEVISRVLRRFLNIEQVNRLLEYNRTMALREQWDQHTTFSSLASVADKSITTLATAISQTDLGLSPDNNYLLTMGWDLVQLFVSSCRLQDAYHSLVDCFCTLDKYNWVSMRRINWMLFYCDLMLYVYDGKGNISLEERQHIEQSIASDRRQRTKMNEDEASILNMGEESSLRSEAELALAIDLGNTNKITSTFRPSNIGNHHKGNAIIAECLEVSLQALEWAFLLSIRHVFEPYAAAIGLMYYSKALERSGQGVDAFYAMEEASVLAVRICPFEIPSIDISLETVRLFIKYCVGKNSSSELKWISARISEINNLIQVHEQRVNIEGDIHSMDRTPATIKAAIEIHHFSKRSADLLSIATVRLTHGQKEISTRYS